MKLQSIEEVEKVRAIVHASVKPATDNQKKEVEMQIFKYISEKKLSKRVEVQANRQEAYNDLLNLEASTDWILRLTKKDAIVWSKSEGVRKS
jgi:hypothetical protein